MRFGKTLAAALVAASVSSSPALAQAASPASALSVSRASASLDDESLQEAIGTNVVIIILVAVAVGLGIYAATDNGNETPSSP